ncbi:hypothetical protein ABPG75_007509 [Micractinium tetrahymenae]
MAGARESGGGGPSSGGPAAAGGEAPRAQQDVWQLLELAAIHHADTLAVVDCAGGVSPERPGRQLTYDQLFGRAAALAAALRAAGVRRGDRVGVLSRNSSHVIELHFAAAALHAVVVNLNIHLAAPELAYILADSQPRLVFADTHCAPALLAAHAELRRGSGSDGGVGGGERIADGGAAEGAAAAAAAPCEAVVWMHVEGNGEALPAGDGLQSLDYETFLTSASSAASAASSGAMPVGLCAEVLAEGCEEDGFHMYYTSGTTGKPKGVVLSHRVVVHHAVGTVKEMNLSRHDVWGHFAPMFHLVDVFAVYAITLVGGRHVTLPTFSPAEVLLAIERERVSASNVASTMVAMLVNNPLAEQLDLACMRVLSCGGSPQSPAVVVRAIALFGCEFFLSYGMTECCGKISMSILPRHRAGMTVEEQMALVTSSGRPFELIDVRVVDELGGDVAKDGQQVGEVWVRGPTVFDGYWGLPEATADSFAPGGWFKTGDLATACPSGYIRVVDRKKDMLLVGGENVYTTEVEAVLFQHPAVHQAAVFGLPSRVMGELVGAAVTLRPEAQASEKGRAVTSRELIDWCAARLAHYKVPSAVHLLPKMPTTGSGKILKTELRRMFGGGSAGASAGAGSDAGAGGASGGSAGSGSVAAAVPAAPAAPAASLAEASAVLAAACGGDVACQALDDGLGVEWGRELLPELTYLLAVDRAEKLASQASLWVEAAVSGKGLRNLAVMCMEKPSPDQLASLGALSTSGARLLVLHVEPTACTAAVALGQGQGSQLHLALAAAREMLPPFAGVLHAPVPEQEATAAATAVAAAQAAVQAASVPAAAVPAVAAAAPVPVSAGQPAADEAAMRSMTVAALGALLGEPAAHARLLWRRPHPPVLPLRAGQPGPR